MSDGETVFQAMRAARVFRHVAANGADRLRRGIGGVEITLRGDPLSYVRIDHPGLDDDLPVGKIDTENAVHARQADNDAARGGQRTSAQARAGAAADKGNFVPGTE